MVTKIVQNVYRYGALRCGQHLLYLGVISMHFRVFSLGQGTEWGIFLGFAKIPNTFWVLEIPNLFFWGGGGRR